MIRGWLPNKYAVISRQSAAINSARAALTIGVIVYHSARIFDPFVYYVKAPETSAALAPLILLGAIWAMPLFFFVAGFALWHSLERRGAGNYVRERVNRLLLPLTVGLLTLVPFQIYISRLANGEHISYMSSMRDYLQVHFTFALPFPIQGLWFDYSHLWFVAYLFSFSLMLLPFVIWLRRRPQLPRISPTGGLAIWIATIVAAAGLEAWIGMEGTGAWDRWAYLIFMALGVLLACQPNFSELLGKRINLIAAAAFLGFTGLILAAAGMHYDINSLTAGHDPASMLWRAGKGAVGVIFLMAIVGSLVNFRPKEAAERRRKGPIATFFAYVSPISLPLYLLHLTLILTLAYFILQWPIPAGAQFLAIVLLTLFSSIAIVEGARRTQIGSLLLGMKYQPRGRPARSQPPISEPKHLAPGTIAARSATEPARALLSSPSA
jgi:surface polysaccharide O-acyltransferase-like enzyme